MDFNTFINISQKKEGNSSSDGILLTSTVSLSRNLKGYPFPGWSTEQDRIKVWDIIAPVIKSIPSFRKGYSAEMDLLSPLMKEMLLERDFITSELSVRHEGCAVVVSSDTRCSIMVNEEEHLCIRVALPCSSIKQAWEQADKWDDLIEKELPYAYSSQWGYLTSSPGKTGTGLCITTLLHLPGFVLSGYLDELKETALQLDMELEGINAKDLWHEYYLFRLSTRNSLGMKEEDMIARMNRIIKAIIKQERYLLTSLMQDEDSMLDIANKVEFAFSTLTNASSLTSRDAFFMLSHILLGNKAGLVSYSLDFPFLELLSISQPVLIQRDVTTSILFPEEERDYLRANMIKQALSEYNIQLQPVSHSLDNNSSQQR